MRTLVIKTVKFTIAALLMSVSIGTVYADGTCKNPGNCHSGAAKCKHGDECCSGKCVGTMGLNYCEACTEGPNAVGSTTNPSENAGTTDAQ